MIEIQEVSLSGTELIFGNNLYADYTQSVIFLGIHSNFTQFLYTSVNASN